MLPPQFHRLKVVNWSDKRESNREAEAEEKAGEEGGERGTEHPTVSRRERGKEAETKEEKEGKKVVHPPPRAGV